MIVEQAAKELSRTLNTTVKVYEKDIIEIAQVISDALKKENKLLLCGNGGSAADCQHIAAEFVNRFKKNRNPLPAIALTTDTSILTAIANDFSFSEVFKKQVEALGKRGDVLLGISTSGSSKNVLEALKSAKEIGLVTVGFTGKQEGAMEELCDFIIKVDSFDTPRIQEVHIFIGHILCEIVERSIFEK